MTTATTTGPTTAARRGYARTAPVAFGGAYTPRAVIYLRVSTIGQVRTNRDEEGFSIPNQRDACMRKIVEIGAACVDEYVDAGESARSADRPKLQEMLLRLEEKRDIDFVVVYRVDRLARNRVDDAQITLAVRKSGARLVSASESIDETPSGMLMHGIMATIAEHYSNDLAVKVRGGMDQKAQQGGMNSQAPIGYKNVQYFDTGSTKPFRTIEVDRDKAPIVSWAFEAYASGDYTLRQLSEALAERGLRTKATKRRAASALYPQNVNALLTNTFYVGIVTWKGIEYAGRHEPLVSVETFARVQAILHSRAQSREKPSRQQHYLRGSLFCKRCGSSMGFVRAKGRSDRYDYFFCWSRHKKTGCDLPYVSAEVVESQVEPWYQMLQVSGEVLLRFRDHIANHMKLQLAGSAKLAKQTRQRITHLEAERRRLVQAHLAGAVPLDILREEQDRITRELAQAGAELANTDIAAEEIEGNVYAAVGLVSQLFDLYSSADSVLRRRLNQACFAGLDVDADGIAGARLTDPMAALVAEDIVKTLGAKNANQDPFDRARGSRLNYLVELTGLEPATVDTQL
jgi:DNA invertase Pin-like site-specific DNA recombinase